MAVRAARAIPALCVNTIDVAHGPRKICKGCFNQEVVVVRQQTKGVNPYFPEIDGFSQKIEKHLIVFLTSKNQLTPIATIHHVIKSALILNSKLSSHAESLCQDRKS